MQRIAISKFKATCLGVIDQVHRTREPVLITKFGKPVAEIVPPSESGRPKSWIGAMAGTIEFTGDIVGPTSDESDWEASRE
jgi:prevent-host-death family protein